MRWLYLILFGMILFVSASGQSINSPGVITYGPPTQLRGAKLDTNRLVYDEQGNALHFYQYQKLLNSGEYTMKVSHSPGADAKYVIEKIDQQKRIMLYGLMQNQMAIKDSPLQKYKPLDITPLLEIATKEELEKKAIVLIFWNPDCPPCTEAFGSINDFFERIQNPQDVVIMAITADNELVASVKLKQKPLKYAQLIGSAGSINNAYNIRSFPAYVVADKDHIIRFAVAGQSPVTIPAFKDAISTILIQ